MSTRLDTISIQRVYARYAQVYDLIFGFILNPGRKLIIQKLNGQIHKGRPLSVLEVGVGTGISLPFYHSNMIVTGIDLSEEMLKKAQLRVNKQQLSNIKALLKMDAQSLAFDENSFDIVIAMYVASVVKDPKQFINEIKRVCMSNGDIFILNHFTSDNKFISSLEKAASKIARTIGFHTDMEMQNFLRNTGLEIVSINSVNFFGYCKLIHLRNMSD